jgi:hypothetical protein
LIGSTGIRTCFLLIEPVWATFGLDFCLRPAKEGKSLPGSPGALSALSINEWKIQLLVETRMGKSRIHEGFGFVGIKGSF